MPWFGKETRQVSLIMNAIANRDSIVSIKHWQNFRRRSISHIIVPMPKQVLRIVGALMAAAGVAILVYAIYSYMSLRQLEATLTAQIPGQEIAGQPTTTPVVMVPSGAATSAAISVPVLDTKALSPSVTPVPAHATPVQPNETTVVRVVGTATAISLQPSARPTSGAVQRPTLAPTVGAAPLALGKPRGTGSPAARIMIPKLRMDLSVEPAEFMTFQQGGQLITDWNVPYESAGHLVSTAQPGEIGNAVLSGHHNLRASGEFGLGVFAGLWNLTVGDEIQIVTEDGKTQYWKVQESFPVKEAGEPLNVRIEHAQQIMGTTPDPTLTLLTCWNGKTNPLAGNTYRWVIHAKLVNVL